MASRQYASALVCLAVSLSLTQCGGSNSPTDPTPPTQTNSITISGSGVNPKNIQIAIGTRVLFINDDTRSHSMDSDPHPEHTDCPEINQVGFLSPGQRRETGNFVQARTCGFHDHDRPDTAALKGNISIK